MREILLIQSPPACFENIIYLLGPDILNSNWQCKNGGDRISAGEPFRTINGMRFISPVDGEVLFIGAYANEVNWTEESIRLTEFKIGNIEKIRRLYENLKEQRVSQSDFGERFRRNVTAVILPDRKIESDIRLYDTCRDLIDWLELRFQGKKRWYGSMVPDKNLFGHARNTEANRNIIEPLRAQVEIIRHSKLVRFGVSD